MNLNSDYKKNIIKLLELSINNENYELEVLFNNIKGINITQFNNIYNRLTKLYGHCDKYPKSLDIILTNYKSNKIIVTGEENILNYYKTNKLNFENISVIEKKPVLNNIIFHKVKHIDEDSNDDEIDYSDFERSL